MITISVLYECFFSRSKQVNMAILNSIDIKMYMKKSIYKFGRQENIGCIQDFLNESSLSHYKIQSNDEIIYISL